VSKRHKPKISPQAGWAIYLRTSSAEAQNPKNSQERQRHSIYTALIHPQNLPVIEEYVDTESGRNPNRTHYQRMLRDARIGKFSHVAVESPDRFGRDEAEAIRALDELQALGTKIYFANSPTSDPLDVDNRFITIVKLGIARQESAQIGQRVRGGLRTKLLQGGWVGKAPDGYLNCEQRTSISDKMVAGQYYRWIELDPKQAPVWRMAWSLLLENRHTLEDICILLNQNGFTYRSGRPFVTILKNGQLSHTANALSRILHNWFYAGWVVSEVFNIKPLEIRGKWEPTISTEEFELGLTILDQRNQKRIPERKHFYLLSGLVYLALDNTIYRLTCSTPNTGRKDGGTPYYCSATASIHFLCSTIDQQIPQVLATLHIQPELIPELEVAYTADLANNLQVTLAHMARLEKELDTIQTQEETALRQLIHNRISEQTFTTISAELRSRKTAIQCQLHELMQSENEIITNLQQAISLISHINKIYATLSVLEQQRLLRLIVKQIVVNAEGNLLYAELLPPFAYLQDKMARVKKITFSRANNNTTPYRGGIDYDSQKCSIQFLLGGTTRIRT
jgi:DNA invertase Pin-like site-specific DNA recombinase